MAVVRESLHKSGENRLGSGQREMRHRELATEQRCSHPNETRDDIEVIEHVPKLRAILRESEAKLEIKNYNPPSLFVWRWVTWGDERKQPYLDCQVYRCHGNRT